MDNPKLKVPNFNYQYIPLDQLIINKDNARYIFSDDINSERESIEELVKQQGHKLINLAKNIAKDYLEPSKFPVVYPDKEKTNEFILADGNRRITSVKLFTTLRHQLDKIIMPDDIRAEFKTITSEYDFSSINCLVYPDLEATLPLIEMIHTEMDGVSTQLWDPIAKDKHRARRGYYTERYLLFDFVKNSKYLHKSMHDVLNRPKWLSKFERLATSTEMGHFFGFNINKDGNLVIYLEEKELIKGLSFAIEDISSRIAADTTATSEARKNYIKNFPFKHTPDSRKELATPLVYDPISKKLRVATDEDKFPKFKPNNIHLESKETPKGNPTPKSPTPPAKAGAKEPDENSAEFPGSKTNTEEPKSDNKKDKTDQDSNKSKSTDNKKSTTTGRDTLIPADYSFAINDQRLADIFNELQSIKIARYSNLVVFGFRALIEFSVQLFLEKRNPSFAKDRKNRLINKIEKTILILEGDYKQNVLKNMLPTLYTSINSYRNHKASDTFSTTFFNQFVHNTLAHPEPNELKIAFNNYKPFLELLWTELNKG